MGYVIRAVDDNAPVPLPMEIELTCDGGHNTVLRKRFAEPEDGANLDELMRAAARAGWVMRVGDQALTLCSFCKGAYGRDRSRQRTSKPEPQQWELF